MPHFPSRGPGSRVMLDAIYYSIYKNSFYGALLFSILSRAEAAVAAMCLDCARLSILFDLLVKDGSQRDSQWDERQIECREGGREGLVGRRRLGLHVQLSSRQGESERLAN